MSRDAMSEQQINIEFVKEIQKRPTLYNYSLPSYSRKDVSDKAWEEVGKATNMAPSACRERWRNLRAVFMRTLRPPRKGFGRKKPYYLSEVMQFIIPYVRPTGAQNLRSEQNTEKSPTVVDDEVVKVEPSSDEDTDTDSLSIHSFDDVMPLQKRPIQDPDEGHQFLKIPRLAQETSITGTDHVTAFVNSLLPELHEMNLTQFKNFKRRVLVLIDDIMTDIPTSSQQVVTSEFKSDY